MPIRLVTRFICLMALCLSCAWLPLAAREQLVQLQELKSPGEEFPNDRITCFLRDQYGILWLGTNRGLIRYHFTGFRWYLPNPADSQALSSGDIKVLFEDKKGQFWVGTNSGLHRMNRREGTFTRILSQSPTGDLWENRNTGVLLEDADERLWIGTKQGLFVLEDSVIREVGVEIGMADAWIIAIFEDANGGIWAASYKQGFFYRAPGIESPWEPAAQSWPRLLSSVHRSQDGQWWLGSSAGLFYASSDPLPAGEEPLVEKILEESVVSLARESHGALWIGQAEKLKRLGPNGDLVEVPVEGLTQDGKAAGVKDIYIDHLGMMWFSLMQGGVYFWNRFRENWTYRNFESAGASAMVDDGANGMWIGTKRSGLLHWQQPQDTIGSYLEDETIRGLHFDDNDQLWIGSESALFRLSSGADNPEEITAFAGRVWRIQTTAEDRLWVGMDDGLWLTRASEPTTKVRAAWLAETAGLNSATITAIEQDSSGRLWVGTYSHGLFAVDPQRETVATYNRDSQPALPSNEVVGLFLDREGNTWICSVSGGLSKLTPSNEIHTFGPGSGFPEHPVVSVIQDTMGRYWANSGGGLIGFGGDGTAFATYSKKDGVLLGGVTPGTSFVRDNQIWFGGTHGILGFDAETFPEPTTSPVIFTSFRTDGREVQQILESDASVALDETHGSFSLGLAQMDPYPNDWGSWQYRRQSQQEDWIELQDHQLQLGRYLPWGGRDTIEIKGLDHHGRPTGMILQVEFLPPWWRSWLPFWLLGAVALIAGLTYLLVSQAERRRRRKLIAETNMALARQKLAEDRAEVAEKERTLEVKARRQHEVHMRVLQQHLEQVSTEMANDLHDGPLSELRGLSFHLTHIKNALGASPSAEKLHVLNRQLVPSITQNLRKVCGELLLPSFEAGLVPELEKYVENLKARHEDLVISTTFDFDEACLGSEGKRILFRIFRTLVKNVGDHAQAKQLDIGLTSEAEEVCLKIADDGIGFSVNESYETLRANKHYGLYMVQFFTKGLGGYFSIEGAAGKGTQALVKLPMLPADTTESGDVFA